MATLTTNAATIHETEAAARERAAYGLASSGNHLCTWCLTVVAAEEWDEAGRACKACTGAK